VRVTGPRAAPRGTLGRENVGYDAAMYIGPVDHDDAHVRLAAAAFEAAARFHAVGDVQERAAEGAGPDVSLLEHRAPFEGRGYT
jgi:hypothetical protein